MNNPGAVVKFVNIVPGEIHPANIPTSETRFALWRYDVPSDPGEGQQLPDDNVSIPIGHRYELECDPAVPVEYVGLCTTNGVVTLYVEGLKPSERKGDVSLCAIVYPEGEFDGAPCFQDVITMTIMDMKLWGAGWMQLGTTGTICADIQPLDMASTQGLRYSWSLTHGSGLLFLVPDGNGGYTTVTATSTDLPQVDVIATSCSTVVGEESVHLRYQTPYDDGVYYPPTEAVFHVAVTTLTVFAVDLDIDSDNNSGYDSVTSKPLGPDRSAEEDAVEDIANDPDHPGKIVMVNDGDADGDGVPDYADGLDIYTEDGITTDVYLPSHYLTPVVLELSSAIPLTARLKIEYPASDPNAMTRVMDDTTSQMQYILPDGPNAGSLRLWMHDIETTRRVATVATGGDYLAPTGEASGVEYYTAAQLGFTTTTRVITLYAEAVKVSTLSGGERIVVYMDLDGDGPEDYQFGDAVRLTILSLKMAEANEQGSITVLKQIKISESTPFFLDGAQISVSNIRVSPDGMMVLGDIYTSGVIDSARCDYVPGEKGTVNAVSLFVNDSEDCVSTLATHVTKVRNPGNLLKPYDFTGTFEGTITDVPLHLGMNRFRLEAADPFTGDPGFYEAGIQINGAPSSGSVFCVGDYIISMDFQNAHSIEDLTSGTTVTISLYDCFYQKSYNGTLQYDTDTSGSFFLKDSIAQVTVLSTDSLEAALTTDSIGIFPCVITCQDFSPFESNIFSMHKASENSNVFTPKRVDLTLQFSTAPSSTTIDTVTALIRRQGGAWQQETLTESGADTNDFGSVGAGFMIEIGPSFYTTEPLSMDPTVLDDLSCTVTHVSLGITSAVLDMEETDVDTLLFVNAQSEAYWVYPSNLTSWTVTVGETQFQSKSDGGEFHPVFMTVLGPAPLVSKLHLRSPYQPGIVRKVIITPTGDALLAGDAGDYPEGGAGLEQEPARTEAIFTPAINQDKLFETDSAPINLTNSVKFLGGFGVGFAGGAWDTVQGTVGLAKGAGAFVYRYNTGAIVGRAAGAYSVGGFSAVQSEFHTEINVTIVAGKAAGVLGKIAWKIQADRINFPLAIYDGLMSGDYTEFECLAGEYLAAVDCVLEPIIEYFEAYQNMTPYEQGKRSGGVMFEVVSLIVPYAKAGKLAELSKLQVLQDFKQVALQKLIPLSAQVFNNLLDYMMLLDRCIAFECFVSGTPIHTVQGVRPVETIQVGDYVLARDPQTGDTAAKRISSIFKTTRLSALRLTFERIEAAGIEGAAENLICTPEHPFYLPARGSFRTAAQLQTGEVLELLDGGLARVVALRPANPESPEGFTTYNFAVENFHTYFVGNQGVLVHNGVCNQVYMRRVISIFYGTKRKLGSGATYEKILQDMFARPFIGKALKNGKPDGQLAKALVCIERIVEDDCLKAERSREEILTYKRYVELKKKFGLKSTVLEDGTEVIPELGLRGHKMMEKHYQRLLKDFIKEVVKKNPEGYGDYFWKPLDKVTEALEKWENSPNAIMHHFQHCGAEVDNKGILILHREMEKLIPNGTEDLQQLFNASPEAGRPGNPIAFFFKQYVDGHIAANRKDFAKFGLDYLERIGFKIPTQYWQQLGGRPDWPIPGLYP